MTKEQCTDCPALVGGDNGEWICDECEMLCEKVERCPETGEFADNLEVETQKVTVYIEEHLCRAIEIKAPSELSVDEAMEYAEDKVREMWDNGEIVLTADDFNGNRLRSVEHECGMATEWSDM